MPIYEYQCLKCGNLAEVFQKSRESKNPKCGECGGKTRRVISQSAFILKGSGWYVTDYPSQSRKAAMEAEHKKKSPKKETDKAKKQPAASSGKSSGKSAAAEDR